MAYVATCTFREPAKTYYMDPGELELMGGSRVVAQTARGLELGKLKFAPREVSDTSIPGKIHPILREATSDDLQIDQKNRQLEEEYMQISRDAIKKFKLGMKPIKVELMHDRSKMYLFYESEERVDFRELLRDLSGQLHLRLQFVQVGPRDAAKVLGGCGPCGRSLCCSTFLGEMPPVTLKNAKDQGLPLTPSKISGACGRLMCCLRYEIDFYRDQSKKLPKRGDGVDTPEGPAKVKEVNIFSEECTVTLGDGRQIIVSGEVLREQRKLRGPVRACKNHVKNGGSCEGGEKKNH